MNILKLAFELFVLYMVYKLIFDFIIPIYNTTKQMKGKMNEMHQKMQGQQHGHNANLKTTPENPVSKKSNEDYIEYEEVK